jgi:hypothetical protein
MSVRGDRTLEPERKTKEEEDSAEPDEAEAPLSTPDLVNGPDESAPKLTDAPASEAIVAKMTETGTPKYMPLKAGSVTLITGPSGAGKSTLGRRLAKQRGAYLVDKDTLVTTAATELGVPNVWDLPTDNPQRRSVIEKSNLALLGDVKAHLSTTAQPVIIAGFWPGEPGADALLSDPDLRTRLFNLNLTIDRQTALQRKRARGDSEHQIQLLGPEHYDRSYRLKDIPGYEVGA